MNKKTIEQIQERVIELLPSDKRTAANVLFEDCCSEMSRLVSSWIKEIDRSSHSFILKGMNVCNTHKSHDVLAVVTPNDDVYIIDPTIWQFSPKKETILLFVYNDLDEALRRIKKLYGGKWQVSEEIIQTSKADQEKYLEIIHQNIRENLR